MAARDFAVGRRWAAQPADKPAFDFVIIEQGERAGYKRCRLEIDPLWWRRNEFLGDLPRELRARGDGLVQEYSHAHLRKYAVLVPADTLSTVQINRHADNIGDYRSVLFRVPEAAEKPLAFLDSVYREALTKVAPAACDIRDIRPRFRDLQLEFVKRLRAS